MFDIASGAVAPVAVGLVGTATAEDPPLTPEPVGPAPSSFEAPPVPLRSFESILAERTAQQATETRRLVVRFLGGEEVELASYTDRDEAVTAARELVQRFAAAETSGEWPDLDGRYVRPGAVASIDVLVSG
jgi:hypothetical protein